MQVKFIAAAVAALGCGFASATVLNPATDTPDVVYYVAGASAQAPAFNAIAKSLFTTPNDVIQITAAAPCGDPGDAGKHVAYFGERNGVKTLLVYRNKDGSGAGVQQLLSNVTTTAAITNGGKVISLPQTGATVAGSSGGYTSVSSTCVARLPVAALSDVKHTELANTVLSVAGTSGYDALSVIKTPVKTGLQGFGIAVSKPLYDALVAANNAAGIPLVNGVQPSIRKADYASLVNFNGSIKSAADLLNDPSNANTLLVARRVDLSGTQASSNLYFLGAKTGGQQNPATAVDFPVADITNNGIAFSELSSTGNVKTALNSPTDYVIGVVSAENIPGTTETWNFVAIDGKSPNFAYDLADHTLKADPYQRQNVASGSYDFAYESYLLYKDASLFNASQSIIKAISDNIKLTTKSNLVGFAYLDNTNPVVSWAPWDSSSGYTGNVNKQSRVSRGGNNLAPLAY